MISYIVATMWRYEPFADFIKDLTQHHLIGEIIIIDNHPELRPNNLVQHEKIKILTTGVNIFVNPAWNWGVAESKYDKLVIANDDLIFDMRVFNKIYDYIIPEYGASGLSVRSNEMHNVDGVIRINEWVPGSNTFGFPMLMFIHKQSWTRIPANLNIYFGDNFIFDNSLWSNKKIHLISDIFYYSPYGQTGKSDSEFAKYLRNQFEKEKKIYAELIKTKGLNPRHWCPEHYADYEE